MIRIITPLLFLLSAICSNKATAQTPIVEFTFDNTLSSTSNTYTLIPSPAPLTGNGWGYTTNRFGEANKAFACTDNSSRYLSANITTLPTGTAARTIEFWYKFNTANATNYMLGYGTAANSQSYGLSQEYNNLVNYGWANDVTVNLPYTVNEWYHFAVTYNGSTANVYRNGQLVGTSTKAWSTAGIILYIGKTTGVNASFNGMIDDLKIYNTALSTATINALYTASASNNPISILYKFKFDNNYSDTSNTRTFAANSGTSFVADRYGNAQSALNINNTGTTVTLPNLPYSAGARTVSLWVKMNSFNANGYNMCYSYGVGAANLANGGGINTTKAFHFGYNNNHEPTVTGGFATNTWYHLAFVFDGTSSKIYKNGVLVGTQVMTGWNTTNNNDLFRLGIGIGNELWFNGTIDDLTIYNSPLSATVIENLYLYNTPTIPNLLYKWNFNNSYSDTSNTRTFAANSGTSFVADRYGNAQSALNINNTGTTVTLPNLPYSAGARTVAMWVKLNSFNANGHNMIYSYGVGAHNLANGGGINATKAFHYGYNNNHEPTVTGGFTANIWYYLTFVFDGTSSKIYKNGVLVGTQVMTGWNTTNNNDLFRLGIGIGNELWFNGTIDDLGIYNTALTDAEVSSLYTQQSLPVQLGSFTAQLKNRTTTLLWNTLTEINTSHFDIEYSNNGKEFSKVNTVQAFGNSSTTKQYSYQHNVNDNDVHFYRLKMVDKDSKFEYSPIVRLKVAVKSLESSVYPTVVTNTATISIASKEKTNAQILITSMKGKRVLQKSIVIAEGSQTISLSLEHLQSGSYIINIQANNNLESHIIIKQ